LRLSAGGKKKEPKRSGSTARTRIYKLCRGTPIIEVDGFYETWAHI